MALLDPIRRELDRKRNIAANNLQRRMTNELKDAAPVDTGETKEKTQAVIQSVTRRALVLEAQSNTPQANFTNDGTRPHVILPRNARVLSWIDQTSGERRFATKVNHPGNDATHWFDRVNDRWSEIVRQEWPR